MAARTNPPGYHVHVTNRRTRRVVATQDFPWGSWPQVGYWLDEQALNHEEYAVRVTFTDDPADAPPAGVI